MTVEVFSDEMVAKENERKSISDGVFCTKESDYDKSITKLYSYIEGKEWENVLEQIVTSPHETSIWVYRKQKEKSNVRWRLLPLHAAIIFKAPDEVIESLLMKNPQGTQCKDDQGSLPLHLAIRNKCSDVIVTLLLMTYPKSIETRDRKNRLPLTLAQSLPIDELRDSYIRALQNAKSYLKIIEPKEMKAGEERLSLVKNIEARDAELARTKERMTVVNNHKKELQVQAALASETIKSTERNLEEQRISLTNKVKTLDTQFTRMKRHHANQLEVKSALISATLQSAEKKAEVERLKLTEKIEELEADLARNKQNTEEKVDAAEINADAERIKLTEKIEDLEADLARTKQTAEENVDAAERKAAAERLRRTDKIEALEAELKRTTQSAEENAYSRKLDLSEKIEALEVELACTKENDAIMDKLNQLEDQLKSRTDTERVLTTKIIALDAMLKDISQSKDRQMEFTSNNEKLEKEKGESQKFAKMMADEIAILRDTVSKQELMIITQSDVKERKELKIRKLRKELAQATAQSTVVNRQHEEKVKEDKKVKNKRQSSKGSKITIRKSGLKQKESDSKQKSRRLKGMKVRG